MASARLDGHTDRFLFGNFVLDTGTRCLLRDGAPVPLSPKEFHALLLLARAEGRAVPKETLVEAIWPDTAVGDTSLARLISVLRRHLGADAIVSVARFGYRMTLAVQMEAAEPGPAIPPEPNAVLVAESLSGIPEPQTRTAPLMSPTRWQPWHRRAIAGTLCVLCTVAGAVWLLRAPRAHGDTLAESDAARWDTLGLFALREGTYFKASRAFEQALQLAPHNPLVHAHLADASLQLNMDEAARQQLLLATDRDRVGQLPERDQCYLDAVRATAVHEYPAATRQYRVLLDGQHGQARADALEDLGRALQREGQLSEATAAYLEAASLQPSNAGVQVHLGLLAGLQRDLPAAKRYLDRATALYQASTNEEGEAEVDYQRASTAYVQADYVQAAALYGKSLDLATRLNDLQMQARALGGLSTVRRWQGDLQGSTDAANREVVLSRTLRSEFWQAEGIMHLANIAIARNDAGESRRLLVEALELAGRVQHPRLQANAEFSMAELDGQTGNYAEELTMARQARQHYQSYGSADGVADASLQTIQAERGLRDYSAALRDATALLANSVVTGSDLFAEDSEAELGHIHLAMGDADQALLHYQRALDLAHKTGSQVPLKTLHVVFALVRLGRRQQALHLFAGIPAAARSDPDTTARYLEVRSALEVQHR